VQPRNDSHNVFIEIVLLIATVVLVGFIVTSLTGCQSIRYDTTVNIERIETATATAQVPAQTAPLPTVAIDISGNADIAKPIEISPARELSPARDAQVRDNQVEGIPQ